MSWTSIEGYPDYEVSSDGRVRSWRTTQRKRRAKPRLLKLSLSDQGYPRVSLCRDGEKPRQHKVHQLVARAFVPNPEGFDEVCHCNGDRTDNRAANLRWDTHQENMRDVVRHGRHNGKGQRRLTAEQACEIRARYAAGGVSYSALTVEYGVSASTIRSVAVGELYRNELEEAA